MQRLRYVEDAQRGAVGLSLRCRLSPVAMTVALLVVPAVATAEQPPPRASYEVKVTAAKAKAHYRSRLAAIAASRGSAGLRPRAGLVGLRKPYSMGWRSECRKRSPLRYQLVKPRRGRRGRLVRRANCGWAPAKAVRGSAAVLAKLRRQARAGLSYSCAGGKRCRTIATFSRQKGERGFAECKAGAPGQPPHGCRSLAVVSARGAWLWAHNSDRVQPAAQRLAPPRRVFIRGRDADISAIASSLRRLLAAGPLSLTSSLSARGRGYAVSAVAVARRSAVLGPVQENVKLDIRVLRSRGNTGVRIRLRLALYVSRSRRLPVRRWLLPNVRQRGVYERRVRAALKAAIQRECATCDTRRLSRPLRWD